jgi:hypothetical protein
MFKSVIIFIVSLLLTSNSVLSQKIEFSGWGATGIILYDREILNDYTQEVYYRGKLQADIKINKKLEAQFDMRGNSADNTITFREFTAKFEYMDYLRFKIGNTKKPFGYELLENQDDLYTVRRSIASRQSAMLGYGGRAVSLMAYYNYKKKRPDFPYSYALSVFKDNSLNFGVGTRFRYHTGDFAFSANYLYQSRGGEEPISGSGISSDITFDIKDFFSSFEIMYLQDIDEGVRRRLQDNDDKVFAFGVKLEGAYEFDLDAEVIKSIEPLILINYFQPDSELTEEHIIQSIVGVNVYFHKKVRARLDADIRLSKDQYNRDYSTDDSRLYIELQVRF